MMNYLVSLLFIVFYSVGLFAVGAAFGVHGTLSTLSSTKAVHIDDGDNGTYVVLKFHGFEKRYEIEEE